ncbi:TetR/AcrR family transcriptional regulator [Oceanibacterium hippocampi]|uniref:Transcriptional regulator BetI n=1 Tax=Oceanibacterium hippocampi TaxID=745714 RepID=A0A1Y5S067_9PROT|nr:TetR/AcrR family transcriptional regulator [Oceanibacterium hippocampi]SLN29651.1 transcriptional regulator BetI [Oceanibacterium hippocampi]
MTGKSGKKAETRGALLDAAEAALIDGKGDCEISDVARRAGVSIGLSYHYYDSKDALVAAVVERFYRRLDEAAMAINPLPAGEWASREARRVRLVVEFLFGAPLAPFVLGGLAGGPLVQAAEIEARGRYAALASENFSRARRVGLIGAETPDRLLAVQAMGGLWAVIEAALRERKRPSTQTVAEAIWANMAAMLRL